MMKVRQQPQLAEGTTPIPISKQSALLFPNKLRPLGSEGLVKEGLIRMSNYGSNDYERDESPVSVISHSATIVSQPSSACTSMEHHLSRLIGNPNRQRIANPSHQSPLSQSMATSGASTSGLSEDDSSANFTLPSLFFAVSAKEEESQIRQAQEQVYTSKGLARKSLNNKHYSEQFATKTTKRSPHDSEVDHATTGSFNSEDDDDHMISIDFQEQNHEVGKSSGMPKHYNGELKEEQWKLSRTTSNAHKEFLSVRPVVHQSASKVANQFDTVSNSRAAAELNKKKHEEGPLKGPQKVSNIAPSLVSRQRSVNSTKLAVPSKWDDAEKWLCYDNHHGSQQHKGKSSSISRQTSLTSNQSTSSSGGRMVGFNKQLSCKEDRASPSGGGLSINDKASECRSDQSSGSSRGKNSVPKAREYKDNGAHSILARHSVLQNTIAVSGRGAQCNVDVASSNSMLAYASQSPSLNEVVENESQTCDYLDTLKCKWNEIPMTNTSQNIVRNYMSSEEIANPHYVLHRNLAAVSVSDGEISRQVNCQEGCVTSQMSASTGSMPGEKKTKDSIRPASIRNWIRSNSDALQTSCKCDAMSSSTGTTRRANRQNVATGMCVSDGEGCENYASDQKFKGSVSYTQRFKQHQILQKLKRKCSPRKGAYTGDQLCKAEEKVAGNITSTNACSQKEFVVQTPTHGRSASMKDACTEVSPSLSRRDMGTQMTPPASSPITSPLQNTSPARHNTPTRTSPTSNGEDKNVNTSGDSGNEMNSRCDNVSALVLESGHWAKLELRDSSSGAQASEKISDLYNEWSPAYGLAEEEIADSKEGSEGQCAQDEAHSSGIIMKSAGGNLEARAAAWEEAERAKFNAKFKREEARIKSWENLQKAKAEADLKKLEVKLERLRSKATEKVMSRMAAAQKRAEEMRAMAEARQAEQIRKLRERACSLHRSALFPGSFAVCFARNYMP